jgi:hypothetical protein
MIATPSRRLWLYPAPDGALEILIFGDTESVATMYARIRSIAEGWRGFDRVAPLVQCGAVLGVRVTVSPLARHVDPVAEGMTAIRTAAPPLFSSLTWHATRDIDAAGMVASW